MTVGIRIKLAGVTQEQFDEVNRHVDPRATRPKGCSSMRRDRSTAAGAYSISGSRARRSMPSLPGSQSSIEAAGVEVPAAPDINEFPVHETFGG